MLLTEYLDSIENTEQEQMFLQKLAEPELKDAFGQLVNVPFVGKLFLALVTLGDSENIEDFRHSGHYDGIRHYSIAISNIEKGYFSIYPGPVHMKKIAKVAGVIGAGLLLLILCKKLLCRR
ncbi:MAG: hypothetical protein FWC93_03845 [Defluviitaleaceae bacterium]|nr:hypothetical protein [Defluviitaleaceae bacterium]